MSKDGEILFNVVGALVLVPVAVAGHVLLDGWVLSWLWQWFAVPLGAKALGWAHCAGLSLVATMALRTYRPNPKETSEYENWRFIGHLVLGPFIFLVVGYFLAGVVARG